MRLTYEQFIDMRLRLRANRVAWFAMTGVFLPLTFKFPETPCR